MSSPMSVIKRNKKVKELDPLVQMLRILGACMVIGTHIKPDILVDGKPVVSRTVLACFVGDGVAIFWMILGKRLMSCTYYHADLSLL